LIELKLNQIKKGYIMTFTIPTVADIVAKYSDFEVVAIDDREELMKLTKAELVEKLLETRKTARTDTVQELARAILQDEELVAANYEDIASAIKTLKPGSNTSSKSIASYVSKKREEWNLPLRIRVSKR